MKMYPPLVSLSLSLSLSTNIVPNPAFLQAFREIFFMRKFIETVILLFRGKSTKPFLKTNIFFNFFHFFFNSDSEFSVFSRGVLAVARFGFRVPGSGFWVPGFGLIRGKKNFV